MFSAPWGQGVTRCSEPGACEGHRLLGAVPRLLALSCLLLPLCSPTGLQMQFFPWDGLGHSKSIPFSSYGLGDEQGLWVQGPARCRRGDLEPFRAASMRYLIALEIRSLVIRLWLWVVAHWRYLRLGALCL